MEDGRVHFVEVPAMAASAPPEPLATGAVFAELMLPGVTYVRFFSREEAC